mgnify:CR=1 FL=1
MLIGRKDTKVVRSQDKLTQPTIRKNMIRLQHEHQGMPLDTVRRKAVNDLNEMIYHGHLKLKQNDTCFCGSAELQKLSRLDRYGLPFGTQICCKCGLISQTISLTEDSLPLFYNKIYWPLNIGDTKNGEFATDIGSSEFCDFLIPEVRKRFSHDIKVLEIGCGQGNRLLRLRSSLGSDFNLNLMGCDYSEEAINTAKLNGIAAERGGVEVFLNKQPADVLILSHVLEHVVDLNKLLDCIDKITHSNSIIYIEVPGVNDLKNKPEYEYDYQDYCVLAHIYNFSLSTLMNILTQKGFVILDGSEYVRLITSKSGVHNVRALTEPYQETMNSLNEADVQHEKWKKKYNNPIRKYLASLYKAILGKL